MQSREKSGFFMNLEERWDHYQLHSILRWLLTCKVLQKSLIHLCDFILWVLRETPPPTQQGKLRKLQMEISSWYIRAIKLSTSIVAGTLTHLVQQSWDLYDNNPNRCSLNPAAAQGTYCASNGKTIMLIPRDYFWSEKLLVMILY